MVVLAGALYWVSMSPGGLSARFIGIKSSITGTVSKITENRDLEKATKTYNGWFAEQHQYPNYSQSQLDEKIPDGSWGAGMDVSWCTPRDVVITSLTASGTVSRLLVDGKKFGDLPGRVPCPANFANPQPWVR